MRYRILGVSEAFDEQGVALGVGGRRLRALLAALALHVGRTASADALIDDVWGDDPPADAAAALQALVGRLRRVLGKGAVTSEPGGGYRLAAGPEDVDLYVFERLVRDGTGALADGDPAAAARVLRDALALWRGPALADLPDSAAATRAEAQRLEAVRARVEAELRLGRAPVLVPELTGLTRDHPYDEPLHALLIRALRDAGRGADALAAYETARRTLAEGLGADPGPVLVALHAELLAPDRPVSPAHAELLAPLPHPAPTPGHPAPAPPRPPERDGNLRPRLNSFVGREPELDAIRADLGGSRLVTLTGPGGSGKTRLAEEAAAGHPNAWIVELAPLERPEAVPGAVVSALGLRETSLMTSELSSAPQDDPVALLVEYASARRLLLILDNCEHVVGAAAELAETLLTRCPGLTVLATSREPLGVPGESVRPVEPLPPDPAHRLFAERARAVRPDFDVIADPGAVAEICRRLDGLPLAIELAAARLRLLTPRQIADRLDDRFRLLTSGNRTALPRQQTLRAVVDWSWDLLDEQERTVLCEASVFAGGWDLEAAEAVCSGPASDLIGALVDKSLLVAAPGDAGTMRYRMLETIHEYAAERAAQEPQLLAEAERRHIAYFRALVETADPLLRSADQLPWIARLETELDNLRAALHRATTGGATEAAVGLALRTGWFWWLRNYRKEGADRIGRMLGLRPTFRPVGGPAELSRAERDGFEWDGSERDGSEGNRSEGIGSERDLPALPALPGLADLPGLAGLAHVTDESHPLYWPLMELRLLHIFLVAESRPEQALFEEADRAYLTRVRDAFARLGPEAARFPGIIWPFAVFLLDGTADVAAALDQALANCRAHGGPWETGVVLMFRAHRAVDRPGNLSGVDDDLAELRALGRRVGDRWMRAQVCGAAAEAAMARSRFDEAKPEFEEALRLAYEVGSHAEVPFLIARLGEIAYRSGERDSARELLAEANTEADRYGVPDSRAFVQLLSALMALEDGDPARARELWHASGATASRGTPPPQFTAAFEGVDARITEAESGPARALAVLADALRHSVENGCAEAVNAGLADRSALLLARLGDPAGAVGLLAAADGWRRGVPRPMPDRVETEAAEQRAATELGPTAYAAARTEGKDRTPLETITLLTERAETFISTDTEAS
ncbi:BTAD domain-containing putative transcriptional regulator [Streptomyces sp. NPDC046821]|uniref:BTAD domain-containing putative transcriptional regulator n=1 Tax=Streptomyces sp. NPDC046821 TaxID=3154702 RepID=UPI003401B830